MAQTVLITLTIAGPDTGPFDLYCVSGSGIVTGPFETGISRAALLAGYVSTLVPDTCGTIRVQSDNDDCPNYIDLVLPATTTTTTQTPTTTTTAAPGTTTTTTILITTSTTAAPTTTTTTSGGGGTTTTTTSAGTTTTTTSAGTTSTTTTTTTEAPTTTTTTLVAGCTSYDLFYNAILGDPDAQGSYTDCIGDTILFTISPSQTITFCAEPGTIVVTVGNPNVLETNNGPC